MKKENIKKASLESLENKKLGNLKDVLGGKGGQGGCGGTGTGDDPIQLETATMPAGTSDGCDDW